MENKYISLNKRTENYNILITGGTGLVGRHLSEMLMQNGYNVAIIGRKNKKNPSNKYFWDIKKETVEPGAIENADYIINLAGAGIADKRWTQKRKNEIIESRTKSIQLLYKTILKTNTKIKVFVSASAVGYYGAVTSENIFNENSIPSNDFLGTTCATWENEAANFKKLNLRTVILRTGIVFTKRGGAFEKIVSPIKKGIGSSIGSGKQFVPWIHIEDLCNMYIMAIEDEKLQGVYNAVAPEHATYNKLGKKIAKVLKKPFFFPNIPKLMLKFALGEMSVLLLEGSRISSKKIQNAGFKFIYSELEMALRNLLVNKA